MRSGSGGLDVVRAGLLPGAVPAVGGAAPRRLGRGDAVVPALVAALAAECAASRARRPVGVDLLPGFVALSMYV